MVRAKPIPEDAEFKDFPTSRSLLRGYVEHGKYYVYKNDPKREPIVQKFNIYIRDKRKIIINSDQLALSDAYRNIFAITHLNDLMTNPSKFVLYQPGIGWTSEHSTLNVWQVNNEKHFHVYFRAIFEDHKTIKCFFCERTDIVYICGHCSELLCSRCFVERRDWYYTYNNFFRCRNCRGINFWNDDDMYFPMVD